MNRVPYLSPCLCGGDCDIITSTEYLIVSEEMAVDGDIILCTKCECIATVYEDFIQWSSPCQTCLDQQDDKMQGVISAILELVQKVEGIDTAVIRRTA